MAQGVAQGVAQGWRRGCAGVAQGLRRGCAGVAHPWRTRWRRCGAGVTSSQQPSSQLQLKQQQQQQERTPGQTPRPAAAQPSTRTDTQTGKGAVVLDRQPARPLCLVSCRAPATCRRRHVTETEPTTPRASHPVRTLHQTAPGDRRTSSFVCGIEKCHVGDRDRLFGFDQHGPSQAQSESCASERASTSPTSIAQRARDGL